MRDAEINLTVANLLRKDEEHQVVEVYAQAWKLACAEFEKLIDPSTMRFREDADWTFLHKFEELKVLYGDPNKATPLGAIHAKH